MYAVGNHCSRNKSTRNNEKKKKNGYNEETKREL